MPDIHICYKAGPKCYAVFWSYGEICVFCGCCQAATKERGKARLHYWQELLKDSMNFKYDDPPEIEEIQRRNVASDMRMEKRRIRYYKRYEEVPDGR